MDDNRQWILGSDGQFVGYTKHVQAFGGQYLARLTRRGSGQQLGYVTGHPTAQAAHTWLAECAAYYDEPVEGEPKYDGVRVEPVYGDGEDEYTWQEADVARENAEYLKWVGGE